MVVKGWNYDMQNGNESIDLVAVISAIIALLSAGFALASKNSEKSIQIVKSNVWRWKS